MSDDSDRQLGMWGATGVGVGAIVGGGILALAGDAFAATGPSAMIAFGLNGCIALLTALSFAEISSKFPESGGTYTFAKKVLSVEAAFIVGWVVWFASIVAAALYALGFGYFAASMTAALWPRSAGAAPSWLLGHTTVCGIGLAATACYAVRLMRSRAGGSQWTNVGKLVVFAVLIGGGIWALGDRSPRQLGEQLRPFFAQGMTGLLQAMGLTFIALQGFDLIAAVAGEIRDPERTIPRAMLGSLGIALAIYLPLLLVIATAGIPPGQSVTALSRESPETIVAAAAQNYLGIFGYWLVLVAGALSMLSALQANLFAASRVAMSMGRDRTLSPRLARLSPRRQTPASAVIVTALLVVAVLLIVPDVGAAGAASSLIFLITFALVHWITILVRQRSLRRPPPFRSPLFPLVPVAGGLCCAALAVFEGVAVPSAGRITLIWLSVGGLLFLVLFARRARLADESIAALDPELLRLRGRNPLVLVPIANPDSANSLMAVANTLAPPETGRVLTLTVSAVPTQGRRADDKRPPLENAQNVMHEVMAASVDSGRFPESLATVALEPWAEITRVAKLHRCESLLLGFSRLSDDAVQTPLDQVMSQVDCDVVVLRADRHWRLEQTRRILVSVGGRGGHDRLLARLLASLSRTAEREVRFLRVLPQRTSPKEQAQIERQLKRIAADLWAGPYQVDVQCSDALVETVAQHATHADLVVLGVQRVGRWQKQFGQFALQVARRTDRPLLLICRGG
jgi:amino acid transporter/nucleotide-binding universal stress UspA family protein